MALSSNEFKLNNTDLCPQQATHMLTVTRHQMQLGFCLRQVAHGEIGPWLSAASLPSACRQKPTVQSLEIPAALLYPLNL